MLRAAHWETTAVAELRTHAEALAAHLAGDATEEQIATEGSMSNSAMQVSIPEAGVAAAPSQPIDQRVYDLYDEYCHGHIDRREFLVRARALVIGGVSALAMAQALFPRYAEAQTISFTDARIKAKYVDYPSPGGNSGQMRGYLVMPAGNGPFPAVVVIHENRGLNPYIEDVARRLGVAGFLALAPDGLAPAGGYPGNDDDGRTLQSGLDQAKLRTDLVNSARYVKAHAASSGKLGAVGFCFGGGIVNHLAVMLGPDLAAGVPFYGAAAPAEDVPKIKAALLVQYAATDERINAQWPAYEAALKAAGVRHEAHFYPETQHGFHNNSTPRYSEAAANLAWERTLAHFRKYLA
jgi:carboxymethylenebutenolidase